MEFERKLYTFVLEEKMKMRMTRNAFNYLLPPLLLLYKGSLGKFFYDQVRF